MKKIGLILILVLLFLNCSGDKKPDSAQALMEKAQSHLNDNNYTEAIKDLRQLTKRFPDDTLAAEARYKLGDAYMAYAKDFEQAIEEYSAVVSKYSDSQFAVNGQFMLGYIYANYLNDYDRARKEYEKFLDLYSDRADSGLIQSVKFELKNLGKDINEIPELKHISS